MSLEVNSNKSARQRLIENVKDIDDSRRHEAMEAFKNNPDTPTDHWSKTSQDGRTEKLHEKLDAKRKALIKKRKAAQAVLEKQQKMQESRRELRRASRQLVSAKNNLMTAKTPEEFTKYSKELAVAKSSYLKLRGRFKLAAFEYKNAANKLKGILRYIKTVIAPKSAIKATEKGKMLPKGAKMRGSSTPDGAPKPNVNKGNAPVASGNLADGTRKEITYDPKTGQVREITNAELQERLRHQQKIDNLKNGKASKLKGLTNGAKKLWKSIPSTSKSTMIAFGIAAVAFGIASLFTSDERKADAPTNTEPAEAPGEAIEAVSTVEGEPSAEAPAAAAEDNGSTDDVDSTEAEQAAAEAESLDTDAEIATADAVANPKEEYQVKSGDGLWNVAKEFLKAEGNENPNDSEIMEKLGKLMEKNGLEWYKPEKYGKTMVMIYADDVIKNDIEEE